MEKTILKEVYDHSKFASFTRQLNVSAKIFQESIIKLKFASCDRFMAGCERYVPCQPAVASSLILCVCRDLRAPGAERLLS